MKFEKLFRFQLMLAVVISSGAFLAGTGLDAQSFEQTLAISGFWDEADALVQKCNQNWAKIEPTLKEYALAIEKQDKEAVNVKTIGKTYSTAQALTKDGQILAEMGESAGIDFSFRGNYATGLIERARDLTRGTDAATKIMGQAAGYKQKTDSKRAKTVQKIDELIAKSKMEAAETELRDMQADVDTFILWLAPRDAQAVIQQYARPSRLIFSTMQRQRTEKTIELVSAAIQQQQLDLDALVVMANQVAADVKTKGAASLDGETVDGAAAFLRICQRWEQAHGKMLNCMGMAYATGGKLGFPVKELFGANSKSSNWTDAGYELHKNMQDALVKIIEASALHASAADVPQLYARYTQAIGYMSGRLSDHKTFVDECNKALQQLAQKDSAFENRVANYRKATDDLLLWRNKIAESATKAMVKEYLPAKAVIGEQKCVPTLQAGLQEVTPALAAHLGKKTSFQNVYGLTQSESFSDNNERFWAKIDMNTSQRAATDALSADLFATNGQLPLTVNAAAALVSAQNNEFDSIGGSIKSFRADGLSARLGKLSSEMATFYQIGNLPKEQADLRDMLLQVDIEPEWIQHRYFFVRLK